MRYSADQKIKTKRSIIEAAGNALKKGGFAGVGVDHLASAAGVISGSVYSNFAGKQDLLKEVIGAYLGAPFVDVEANADVDWRRRLEAFLRTYISPAHRRDPVNGCVMPALSADVSRASIAVRRTYQRKMSDLIDKMSNAMVGAKDKRRNSAWSVLAMMVGAITVARALPDGSEADEVVHAALESALRMLDE